MPLEAPSAPKAATPSSLLIQGRDQAKNGGDHQATAYPGGQTRAPGEERDRWRKKGAGFGEDKNQAADAKQHSPTPDTPQHSACHHKRARNQRIHGIRCTDLPKRGVQIVH